MTSNPFLGLYMFVICVSFVGMCGSDPVQDKWTATTLDGKRTAQFEHTLLITKNGVEPLTGKLPTSPPYFWEIAK